MQLKSITPAEALVLSQRGAQLVDVREPDEFARRHVAGARNVPLGAIETLKVDAKPVIFMCRSGNRTSASCSRLADTAGSDAMLLSGGIDAWAKAGLPVVVDKRQPLEIMRQVQIAAGTLILLGVVLGSLVDAGWFALSAFVGAGLAFAGITGWCGMARLLAIMPWNRRVAA